MTDSQPFASEQNVRALCTRCGKAYPPETMSCSSCGAELGGETILDDVHGLETVLLGTCGATARAPHAGTPDREAFPSEPPTQAVAPTARELPIDEPTDDEPTDDEIGLVTAELREWD